MKRNTNRFLLLGKRYLNDRFTLANQISLFFANLPLLPYGDSLKMETNLVHNYERKPQIVLDKLLLCDATGMSTKDDVITRLLKGISDAGLTSPSDAWKIDPNNAPTHAIVVCHAHEFLTQILKKGWIWSSAERAIDESACDALTQLYNGLVEKLPTEADVFDWRVIVLLVKDGRYDDVSDATLNDIRDRLRKNMKFKPVKNVNATNEPIRLLTRTKDGQNNYEQVLASIFTHCK
jgi:hypothetical protein